MEIKCAREDLLKGLNLVEAGISTKTTLPILSNILVQAERRKITLFSTDLEIGIKHSINGEIIEPGEITIPAKKFTNIVRELSQETITIKTAKTGGKEETEVENQVIITSGKAYFSLMGIPPKDEFPPFPKYDSSKAVTISSDLLRKMVNLTSFAVSYDQTRYILNGVCFVGEKKDVKMIATDGRRLSYIKRAKAFSSPLTIEKIIPTKAINHLNHILSVPTKTEETEIIPDENQMVFKNGETILTTRLIEGNFPNYEQVIPGSFKMKVEIDREQLLQATRRAALLTDERNNSVKYLFRRKSLVVSSTTPDVGSAQDELSIDYTGEEITIAYNPTYVIDVLKNLTTPKVYLELTNPLSPGVIRPAELPEGEDYLYVVMPMRI